MQLSIYSLQSTLFEGEVKSVTIPTAQGEITVLDDHLPLVTLARKGDLRYIDTRGEEKTISFTGGIVEVRPESEVVILAN